MQPGEAKNILITGLPGSGKTTLIRKLADELREYGPAGFYTGEIRSQGARKGFMFSSLDQKTAGTLAHVNIKGLHRVGRYGVDLGEFERFLEGLALAGQSATLVIIDEIGKMECLSAKFRDLVTALLSARAHVIATIAMRAGGFIDTVKHRPDVDIVELSAKNRNTLASDIRDRVRSMLPVHQ